MPEPFAFDRTGPRVPAIAISPWVAKGLDSTFYEHSTIPATLKSIFNLKADYLSARDKASNLFLKNDEYLKEMRDDCPVLLPNTSPSIEEVPLKPI